MGEDQPQDDGPERFDRALLTQPPAARVAWFERECTIEHTHLLQARDAILQIICSPGEGPSLNRLGTMVLVIGPMRVGKTTLIRLLEQELIARAGERMRRSPAHRPFVSISATGPGSGRFDWIDYYTTVLRQVNNPFLDRKPSAIRVRDMREAMEEALIQHCPYAVIVDEAHHLAKAASGRTLQDQLDHLKYLENRTGVCHVLVVPTKCGGSAPSRPSWQAGVSMSIFAATMPPKRKSVKNFAVCCGHSSDSFRWKLSHC
jgi:AAA domain